MMLSTTSRQKQIPSSLNGDLERPERIASTLKGLIIHTATDLGTIGPDYKTGWGLMNTLKAAELISADASVDSLPNIKEIFLNDQQVIDFSVTATGSEPLKVTICWNDPAGTPVPGTLTDSQNNIVPNTVLDPIDPMLMNDLDLRIVQGTTAFLPWLPNPQSPSSAAGFGDNSRDNIEQVVINNPTAGETYRIFVTHKGTLQSPNQPVLRQSVSIILSGNVVAPAEPIVIEQILPIGSDQFALFFNAIPGALYRVESSSDLTTFQPSSNVFRASRDVTGIAVQAPANANQQFWRIARAI
jgi:hypothetical protein